MPNKKYECGKFILKIEGLPDVSFETVEGLKEIDFKELKEYDGERFAPVKRKLPNIPEGQNEKLWLRAWLSAWFGFSHSEARCYNKDKEFFCVSCHKKYVKMSIYMGDNVPNGMAFYPSDTIKTVKIPVCNCTEERTKK